MPTLTWVSRDDDLKQAAAAPYRLLEAVPELTAGDGSSGNMLIQGDNLDALKALLPYYAGRVKCIYIDPPFNTGDAFEHYDDNLEHSLWLSMMYPRIELLRELLQEDGSIFVHLDDNEIAYATVVLDEIFGRKNRISLISFKQSSVSGPKARNPGVVTTTNFLVLYAKAKSKWQPNNTYRAVRRDQRYGTFISNRSRPHEEWTFETLSSAIARHVKKPFREWKRAYNGDVEEFIHQFVLEHRDQVVQLVAVAANDVNAEARVKLERSLTSGRVERHARSALDDYYFFNGKQIAFYNNKTRLIDNRLQTAERVSNLWDDLLSNNVHQEGGVRFPNGKKPEALVRRCFDIGSEAGDLVLDSFLGSGTAAAAAHKMGRKYIGIETGEHAVTHCVSRLRRVIEGEQTGISSSVAWRGGGGFAFYRLGEAVFGDDGRINPAIGFAQLASHIWFSETGVPLTGEAPGPWLGVADGRGLALLYNGILGDKSVGGGNVLTAALLKRLRGDGGGWSGPITIYAEASRLGPDRLKAEGVTFKQTPYDVRAR